MVPLEEMRLLVISDILQTLQQVHDAVLVELAKNTKSNSRSRVLYGANVQYASSVQTLNIIMTKTLNDLANKTMMA